MSRKIFSWRSLGTSRGVSNWLGNSVTMSSGRHVRRLRSNATPQVRVVRGLEDQLTSPGCSKDDWARATDNVSAAARTTAQNTYASDATERQAWPEETIARLSSEAEYIGRARGQREGLRAKSKHGLEIATDDIRIGISKRAFALTSIVCSMTKLQPVESS